MAKKKNDTPIPFEEALKICTKGSHQKVIWRCPQCTEEGVRYFKAAIVAKRCRKCNSREHIEQFHKSGPENNFYGKTNPNQKSGADHPNFKGPYLCQEDGCGKEVDRRASYCLSHKQKGDRNHMYRHDLTSDERETTYKRNLKPGYREWAKAVKARDNYACQKCCSKGTADLVSHHLNAWSLFPDLRIDLDNGATLCECCHDRFHMLYGKRTTREMYLEWLEIDGWETPSDFQYGATG